MPEAAVNEYSETRPWKDKIRTSPETGDRRHVDAVPQTLRVDQAA